MRNIITGSFSFARLRSIRIAFGFPSPWQFQLIILIGMGGAAPQLPPKSLYDHGHRSKSFCFLWSWTIFSICIRYGVRETLLAHNGSFHTGITHRQGFPFFCTLPGFKGFCFGLYLLKLICIVVDRLYFGSEC